MGTIQTVLHRSGALHATCFQIKFRQILDFLNFFDFKVRNFASKFTKESQGDPGHLIPLDPMVHGLSGKKETTLQP